MEGACRLVELPLLPTHPCQESIDWQRLLFHLVTSTRDLEGSGTPSSTHPTVSGTKDQQCLLLCPDACIRGPQTGGAHCSAQPLVLGTHKLEAPASTPSHPCQGPNPSSHLHQEPQRLLAHPPMHHTLMDRARPSSRHLWTGSILPSCHLHCYPSCNWRLVPTPTMPMQACPPRTVGEGFHTTHLVTNDMGTLTRTTQHWQYAHTTFNPVTSENIPYTHAQVTG